MKERLVTCNEEETDGRDRVTRDDLLTYLQITILLLWRDFVDLLETNASVEDV